ncbi:MAG: hypothetical protein FJ304_25675 [Planctomycetes bacterium]|nr:hypothetical protein [Planctomycetota bacterium]
MPLRDHFHPPVSLRKPWEGVLLSWAVVMVTRLNRSMLPERFERETRVLRGPRADITSDTDEDAPDLSHVVPAVPNPVPPLACEVVMADADTFEINVYKQTGGLKLVAAIELVSP